MTERPVRLEPLDPERLDDAARAALAPMLERGRPFNVFLTLARHPDLLRRWLPFANHVLLKNTLPPREREMAILRIGWLCAAPYEWAQHVRIALDETDLDDAAIDALRQGPDAPAWSPAEAALLRATDELHRDACVSDGTWQALREQYSEHQVMDLVFTVGQYRLVSTALNTFGVPLDPGLPDEGLP
jgi:4-carboxymuconolactone decarboxylase